MSRVFIVIATILLVMVSGCGKKNDGDFKTLSKEEMTSRAQKESYVFGVDHAKNLENLQESFDPDAYVQGFRDQIKKYPFLFSDVEMDAIRKTSEKEVANAKEFLSENIKSNKDVKSTRSGLQYQIIKQGEGEKPKLEDKIKINYSGSLVNGEYFENTFSTGEPATFQLKGVIKGFQEGLMLMNEGSRYKFFIPPNLGYGPTARGKIPPNSVLIYEVELMEIIE